MGAHSTAPRLRRARSILTVAILTAGALVWGAQSSLAVHDTGMFELDGNVVHDSANTPPYDWGSLFGAGGSQLITPDPNVGPVLADTFVDDTDAGDTSYFAGGTKIDDRIHNMACGGPAANDKTSMDFVYAALIQIPAGAPDNAGDQVLYLAVEKQAAGNGGDNAFGFWLFKDNTVGCSGAGSFTGAHTDGDLFIDGTFTNGGGSSDVEVFRWNGNDTTGSLGSSPVATGNVCGVVANDQQCAIANNGSITAGPWRSSSTMAPNTFVEAGIDLTTVLGSAGGCFSTFLADSQSSQDTNSQPKDYSGGQFDTCVPPDVTTTATPGGSTVPLGASNQHDVASISSVGGRPAPTGTMQFVLCKPSEVTAGGCESGGTNVGSPVTISGGSATSPNASGSLLSTVGTYCWRAEYTPDTASSAFYTAGSETNADTECFTVVRNTTLIGTAASSQTVGAAVHDVATLSGATANAGGTITFQAWGPSDTPDCSGNPVFTSTVNVSGNGNYNSGDFTPDTAGKYYWIASYSGDDNNLGSAGSCGDAGETSTVGKRTTLIGTAASSQIVGTAVHDVATLSGGLNPTGTITFRAYGPSDTPDCSGTAVFTSTVTVSGNGDYQSDDFTPSTAGKYYWIASYSGDANNLASSGSCGDQGETSTIGKKTTLIATAASSETIGAAVHDTATLSGGLNPTGTITFNLYGPSATADCSGVPVFTATVAVDHGNGDYGSGNFTPTTAGSYYWTASYSGDVNNLPSDEACGAQGETSVLVKRTTGIVTAATNATIGDPVHDVATLSGATANAGGTITFNLYGPSATADCSGAPVYTNTVNVSGPGNYNSGNFTPSTAGKYYWIASYSGDVNNLPSSGSCGDSGETSTIGKQPTSIATSATSGTIGDAVHDVATLSGATANAGGTITFNLYGPSATADCSGVPVYTNTVNVSGPGDYNSGNFTPTTAGSYYWVASYSGDVNNQPSSGSCGDDGETSTLLQRPTGIVTSATSGTIEDAVHDVATLSGATADASGTITFNLYGPGTLPDCSGTPVYTNSVLVDGNGDYNSGDFTPTTAGSYYWIASYSGDVNNLPSSGTCGDQGETSTLAQHPTAIVTTAASGTIGDAITDTATLTGGTADIIGSISFSLYGPSDAPDCSGTAIFTSIVPVTGNGQYMSDPFTPVTAGPYYWVASYSGDVNNLPSTGTCGDDGETSTINQAPTSISTAASSETIGGAVHDVATLSGATADATGTITFNLYGPSATADCSGDPVFTSTVDVAGPGDYQSGNFTAAVAGSYYWIASYSGDVNNLPSTGTCGDDGETSGLGQQATAITTRATTTSSVQIADIASLTGATADATGTITFNLYGPSDTADCSGDPVFTDTVDVAGPGNYKSGGFTPTAFGTYYWTAAYSGDVNNLPSEEPCGSANESSTFEAAGSSSSTPPPPPTSPPSHGTSGTGAPVKGELELVVLLLGAGIALLLIGRRRRITRQH